MKQITIKSADSIIDDTQLGLDVDRLNRTASMKGIDVWPGREEALGILEWSPMMSDDEYAEIEKATDDSIAGALIRERFRGTFGEILHDVYAVLEDALDQGPRKRKSRPAEPDEEEGDEEERVFSDGAYRWNPDTMKWTRVE